MSHVPEQAAHSCHRDELKNETQNLQMLSEK